LRRLHRKVVVVDEAIGFVGGINIIDDYDVPDHIPPRIDYALRIEGAILASIVESVKKLWRAMAWVNLHKIKQSAHPVAKQTALDTTKPSLKAAFLIRNNVLHRHDIEEAYLEAISQATSEILIANAYFLPGKRFRRALVAAAKRGVSVKLLLQGHKEYFLMVATHAFYPEFLKAGIAIYEYHKSFMHSKVAVIDSEWATVGSSNIDPFSLLLSLEANVVIYDKVFADTLRNDIHVSLQQAHTITADTWKHVSMFKRFRAWLAYGFVKLSLSIIGYSND
jgi:cardiolipin synthase